MEIPWCYMIELETHALTDNDEIGYEIDGRSGCKRNEKHA